MKMSDNEIGVLTSTKWIDRVLQGIAYWMGYKKQLFNGHLINEGAIVSEVTYIMSSCLGLNQKIACEKQYSHISSKIKSKEFADIVRYTDDKIDLVLEVKRFENGQRLIEADIYKLSKAKESSKDIRCFLLLVSQSKAPFPYINEIGVADRLKYPIPNSRLKSKVIRVCKSVSSFREDAFLKANYACLIEVL